MIAQLITRTAALMAIVMAVLVALRVLPAVEMFVMTTSVFGMLLATGQREHGPLKIYRRGRRRGLHNAVDHDRLREMELDVGIQPLDPPLRPEPPNNPFAAITNAFGLLDSKQHIHEPAAGPIRDEYLGMVFEHMGMVLPPGMKVERLEKGSDRPTGLDDSSGSERL